MLVGTLDLNQRTHRDPSQIEPALVVHRACKRCFSTVIPPVAVVVSGIPFKTSQRLVADGVVLLIGVDVEPVTG